MSMEKSIAVYIRGNTAYVAPHAGTAGLYVEVEPVLVVPTETSQLAKALKEAAERTATSPGITNFRNYQSPVLAAAGVGSLSKFERTVRHFIVKTAADGIQIQRFRRASGNKGFEADGDPIDLSAAAPFTAIAEEILKHI
jgi:hypothetical protein